MLGKEWGRVELDFKEPQQPYLAAGQGGAEEVCLGPCRRRQASSGNVGQDGSRGHICKQPYPSDHHTKGPHQSQAQKEHKCDMCHPPPHSSHCCFWPQFSFRIPIRWLWGSEEQAVVVVNTLPPPPTFIPSPTAHPSCLGQRPNTKLLLENWDPLLGRRDLARIGHHLEKITP